MLRGSAQTASGKDIFLVLNDNGSISEGLTTLGITKDRVRYIGQLHASMSHFIIEDIDQDGSIDIGLIQEELYHNNDTISEEGYEDSYFEVLRGPFYKQNSVVWYIYCNGNWGESEITDQPDHFDELLLIDMIFSPVDFFGYAKWRTYDPEQWDHEFDLPDNLFNPEYRKALIQ